MAGRRVGRLVLSRISQRARRFNDKSGAASAVFSRRLLAETHVKKLMSISGARPARAPIHYTMSGPEDVWLLNGFAIEHTCYGEGVRIEDADGLHRALALTIVSDKASRPNITD